MKVKSNKKRLAYVIRLCVLYLMVAFCLCLTPTLSRYKSEASGDSTGQVAKFDVDLLVNEKNVADTQKCITLKHLHPDNTCTVKVQINNESEVGISYEVTAASYFGALPLDIKVENSNGTLTAGGSTETINVIIQWDENKNDINYSEEIDLLIITLHAEQID